MYHTVFLCDSCITAAILVSIVPTPRPAGPRLFPYTTLFRSDGGANSEPAFNGPAIFPSVDMVDEYKVQTNNFSAEFSNSDRKSTRLNSSHRCISYAVFCLKKKTILYAWVITVFHLTFKSLMC